MKKYQEIDRCQLCGSWFDNSTFQDERREHNLKCYSILPGRKYWFSVDRVAFEYGDYIFYADMINMKTEIYRHKYFIDDFNLVATINRFLNPNTITDEELDKFMLLI